MSEPQVEGSAHVAPFGTRSTDPLGPVANV